MGQNVANHVFYSPCIFFSFQAHLTVCVFVNDRYVLIAYKAAITTFDKLAYKHTTAIVNVKFDDIFKRRLDLQFNKNNIYV